MESGNPFHLLDVLNSHNVPFVIIGGHAVSLPYIRGSRIMMLVTDFGFLVIFDYIPGCPDEPVEQLFDTAEEHGRYKYASLQWLRAMKSAANRPKDQMDLENLPTDL